MKCSRFASSITVLCLLAPASAVLEPYSFIYNSRKESTLARTEGQSPLLQPPNIGFPPSAPQQPLPDMSSDILISDVIGRERNIGIFSGFTRDIDSVGKRLNDGAQNATVLAPENGAVTSLPRKPWEDPKDYEQLGANAYDGKDGESRAHKNLRRFVEAHIVPDSPWNEGQKVETLAGNAVWWESKDGKKLVSPAFSGKVEFEFDIAADPTSRHRSYQRCG